MPRAETYFDKLPLPSCELIPGMGLFNHPSTIHGQLHVGRVMIHAFRVLESTENREYTVPLWASVYLHDLERNHDGICYEHGRRAAESFDRDCSLRSHLTKGGLQASEYASVQKAVELHSRPHELSGSDPDWTLTAMLKDADGLDRVRLGDLDPSYLRFDTCRSMVPFAEELFERSERELRPGVDLFADLCRLAQEIEP